VGVSGVEEVYIPPRILLITIAKRKINFQKHTNQKSSRPCKFQPNAPNQTKKIVIISYLLVQGNKKAGIYFQKEISPCKLVFLSAI
jgi:hypothetical protein